MFDVGGPELVVILLAALLLFGPNKIPEIVQMLSKGMRTVKNAQQQFKSQLDDIQSEISKQADVSKIREITDMSDLEKKFSKIKEEPKPAEPPQNEDEFIKSDSQRKNSANSFSVVEPPENTSPRKPIEQEKQTESDSGKPAEDAKES